MGGRYCICRTCKRKINTSYAIKIFRGKQKNFFCSEECVARKKKEWDEIDREVKEWDNLYNYIISLLGYTSEQKPPKSFITRLQDLRNGTIIQKGIGKIVKSKSGYPYPVILETFVKMEAQIKYYLKNRHFRNESMKINYIMAIIESNINDVYVAYTIRKRHTYCDEDIADINIVESNSNVDTKQQSEQNSFMDFLTNEEIY